MNPGCRCSSYFVAFVVSPGVILLRSSGSSIMFLLESLSAESKIALTATLPVPGARMVLPGVFAGSEIGVKVVLS